MSNMFPEYNTQLFTDIYSNVNDFLSDYNGIGIPALLQTANVTTLYYLLYGKFGNSPIANLDVNQFKYKLFSIIWQYGPTWEKRLGIQSTLRAFTEADLKSGAQRVLAGTGDITTNNTGTQTNVKTGNVTDANTGSDKHNHAYNPETAPGTGTDQELNYINEQQVDKYGRTTTSTFNNLQDQRTDNLKNKTDRNTTDTETLTIGKLDAYQQLWDMLDNDVTAEFLSRFNICFKQFVRPARVYIYESEE